MSVLQADNMVQLPFYHSQVQFSCQN